MRTDIEERAVRLAEYITENRATVRAAAKKFGVSKSTVHKDITERLEGVSPELYSQVRSLLERGLDAGCTAMQAIGYKEAALAVRGELTCSEALELIKRETRRYAKRQLTWLRGRPDIHWIRWDAEPDFARARRDSTIFLAGRGIR